MKEENSHTEENKENINADADKKKKFNINKIKDINKDDIKDKFLSSFYNTNTFNKISKLENDKKFFGFIIIICVAVILIQGILNYNLITANRTIVLPPSITKEFWVTDKKLSESYFEQIGFYIADRVLSVSPETVDSSHISLLPFFDSNSSIKKVKERLKEQADFVKQENMYQIFYPLRMYPDYEHNRITIEGSIKKFIGELLVYESAKDTIIINYDIKAGRFIIKSLEFKYKK